MGLACTFAETDSASSLSGTGTPYKGSFNVHGPAALAPTVSTSDIRTTFTTVIGESFIDCTNQRVDVVATGIESQDNNWSWLLIALAAVVVAGGAGWGIYRKRHLVLRAKLGRHLL